MTPKPEQPKMRDRVLSALDALIQALSRAKDDRGIPPSQNALDSASSLLNTIRDPIANKGNYVELRKSCAGVCEALDRSFKGRQLNDFDRSVLDAIEQLTTAMAEIQGNVVARGKRNVLSQLFHSKDDKEAIAAGKEDLDEILRIFMTELLMNNYALLMDVHRNAVADQGSVGDQHQSTKPSVSRGELPPQPPRACFGREELVESIVVLAKNLTPIALIGAGGIGKTSIALTVLHHDRIKERFGDNRRFIRCDEFRPSRGNFLARLSKAIGAGVENPEDLTPLRWFLSSKEMILILDNAESILDPQGTEANEIRAVVMELSRFRNICLGITSRISIVPCHCKRLVIPTLSMESACDIFYAIHDTGGRSDIINNLIERLDFHALSITLLATTAANNQWDYERLAKEWEAQRVDVLRDEYNESLAATIELSLASPTFCKLGDDARSLLGVIAFFPQGINEDSLDQLFPAIVDRKNIFDKFCVLSLTSRSNGFITMLAPIRDYLRPQDPKSSPLLCATKDRYFGRLSVDLHPDKAGFGEARWIVLEDANVEHLLDVFTSIDTTSDEVWRACRHFLQHLLWCKPRRTVLMARIEGLPDDHRFKSWCLFDLAELFNPIGDHAERKRLLVCALELERNSKRGDDVWIALILNHLADTNRLLDLHDEGIEQAKEAWEIFKVVDDEIEQAGCLNTLAWLLLCNNNPNGAEEAATRAINVLPEKGEEFLRCRSHRLLGNAYRFKCAQEESKSHFHMALDIALNRNWNDQLFWIHYELAWLLRDEGEFDYAHDHIGHAKLYAADNLYNVGGAMEFDAWVWYQQRGLKEARSAALHAKENYEKIGAPWAVGRCEDLLGRIEMEDRHTSVDSDSGARGVPSSAPTKPHFFKLGK